MPDVTISVKNKIIDLLYQGKLTYYTMVSSAGMKKKENLELY